MGWLLLPAVLAGVFATAFWWMRRFVVATVSGPSMESAYSDGDQVLARPVAPRRIRAGQVVVVLPEYEGVPRRRRQGRQLLIKRVAAVPGDPVPGGLGPALAEAAGSPVPDGRLVLLGDNPEHSVDSRQEGFVDIDRVRGVVIRRLSDAT
ncbi:S26 family signal peptidase [Streptosporangium sp. NPDC000396]|uniref:S26 family signal peptidase n=1 Tax=Streptosporangium sp. NPDC000396 TaxID=3366185 RepID=UPI0036C6F35C